MSGRWVPPDTRDEVVDVVRELAGKTELPVGWFLRRLGIHRDKLREWGLRYGRCNEHGSLVPRDHWLEPWERAAIVRFRGEHPLDGYRRLSFMMIDAGVVAVSPSTVFRVLRAEGLLDRWSARPGRKGTGFEQPTARHQHWHVDISYLNLGGTFHYLCSILDGYSRKILHWEIRESMKEADVELVVQRAREKYPQARPRVISDNGPQFVARDFKLFIREAGMTHVRTSPYYPQSNGKLERWHQTLKVTTIRPHCPATKEEAERLVARFVHEYNHVRLHSAIGYVTPEDKFEGREAAILAERDRRLEAAREARRQRRQCA